jgi:hypothetical protein
LKEAEDYYYDHNATVCYCCNKSALTNLTCLRHTVNLCDLTFNRLVQFCHFQVNSSTKTQLHSTSSEEILLFAWLALRRNEYHGVQHTPGVAMTQCNCSYKSKNFLIYTGTLSHSHIITVWNVEMQLVIIADVLLSNIYTHFILIRQQQIQFLFCLSLFCDSFSTSQVYLQISYNQDV